MVNSDLTVGKLRQLLSKLPDSARINPDWLHADEMSRYDPGVMLHGFSVVEETRFSPAYLSVHVSLFRKGEDEE